MNFYQRHLGAKSRAVIEFMDCAPEREAELLAVIRKPRQGSLLP